MQQEITFKARPSALARIMTDPQGKTNAEKYADLKAKIEEAQAKYKQAQALGKQDLVPNQKLLEKIKKMSMDLMALEPVKDQVQLSKTCITYLEEWIRENYFGRRKIQPKTKPLTKGVEKEFEGIHIANMALGTNYKKCDKTLENEYLIGHRDIDGGDHVVDIKVSGSFSTFPILDTELEGVYEWQMQGYMALEPNHKRAQVIKVLVNSPEWQIRQKIKYSYYQLLDQYPDDPQTMEEEHKAQIQEIMMDHVFDQSITIDGNTITDEQVIPIQDRIRIFEVARDEEMIARIGPRVEQCRAFIHDWFVKHNSKKNS